MSKSKSKSKKKDMKTNGKENTLRFLSGTVLFIVVILVITCISHFLFMKLSPSYVDENVRANRTAAVSFFVMIGLFVFAQLKTRKAQNSVNKYYVDLYRVGLYIYYCVFSVLLVFKELQWNLLSFMGFGYVNLTVILTILSVYIGIDSALNIYFSYENRNK